MTRAALVWCENEHLRVAPLPDDTPTVIGRAGDATLRFDARTLSRHQAAVSCRNGVYAIQQLGASNPTLVDGAVLTPERPPLTLRDGAAIELPEVRLVFHDLAAADRLEFQARCGYCSRAVQPVDLVCWYCGTSIDSAPGVFAVPRSVVCRLVAQNGASFDLCASESLAFRGDGAIEIWRQGSRPSVPAVVAREDGAWLVLPPDAAEPEGSCRRLRSGTELHTVAGRFAVLVR
ncbi:MAG TPA: FHA domain-containing protein [Dehalococcoidia bacterium]|nr:FHA domain-containing protein [Dehalococcoidia bacterium]